MKRKVVLNSLFICLLFFQTGLFAADISGYVKNASRDSIGVPSLTVGLQVLHGGEQAPHEVLSTQSGKKGYFVFSDVNFDSSSTYFVAVDYQGVRYYSNGFMAAHQAAIPAQNIILFDSTQSTNMVSAVMHHLIIDDLGDAASFRETRVMNNPTNFAVTNAIKDSIVGDAIFKFQLPVLARNVQPLSQRMQHEFVQHGNFLFDRGIALPGNRQISYAYEIPWQKSDANVSLDFSYMTRTFDVFLSDENLSITSAQLTDQGPFNIRGTQYKRYGTGQIPPGTRIKFTVHRLGKTSSFSSFTILLTGFLLSLGIAFALVFKSKENKKYSPVDYKKLIQEKKEIINKIAEMDLQRNTSDPFYQSERKTSLERLMEIELVLANHGSKDKK